MAKADSPNDLPVTAREFTTTHWSVVLAAKKENFGQAAEALEKLCHIYWRPLYAYIRREGYGIHDAQDLTQGFFSVLLEKDYLSHLRDQRGRFRSFLLTFLKHFLSHERERANALKRGGRQTWISLDACEAEERDALDPVDGLSADQIYDRRWARAIMDAAVGRLREEYAKRRKAELFEELKNLQPGEHSDRSYSEIGATLGLSEQAIKNAVHSFRRRYGELLRDEIARTVDHPGEVEAEVRELMRIFAR